MEIVRKHIENSSISPRSNIINYLKEYISESLKDIYKNDFKIKSNFNKNTKIFEFQISSDFYEDFSCTILLPFMGNYEGSIKQIYNDLIDIHIEGFLEIFDCYNLEINQKNKNSFRVGGKFKPFKV